VAKSSTARRIEYMALDELQPADINPKRHSGEIDRSFERFGYTEPVLLDERTGKLIAGHGRLEALKGRREAGQAPPDGIGKDWTVPVVRGWKSQNDDEAAAALVASNQLTTLGGWDDRELFEVLNSLDDLDGVGFTLEELDEIAKRLASPNFSPISPDELPRLDKKDPITCPECGHTWQKD
jgi:ParB-like chromosome segregation protein Spo0J